MPICTSCTHPTPFLYTVYESAYNFRLEQCSSCLAFADPYVEYDTLTIALDLILLKREVYRHLLFNRGTGSRKAGDGTSALGVKVDGDGGDGEDAKQTTECEEHSESEREKFRWVLIFKLGCSLIFVDAFIRWAHLSQPSPTSNLNGWSVVAFESFLRTLAGCFIETIAFHAGITIASWIVLRSLHFYHLWRGTNLDENVSGIRKQLRLTHIPLTLLYSSLTKLFLLTSLSIWRPVPPSGSASPIEVNPTQSRHWNTTLHQYPLVVSALEIFDEDKLDREWVIRNVLGGMSAGFGLRVVLDCNPIFTTMIILVGWVAKTAVAEFVSSWVGGDEKTGEMWLAYSIP
ncbi:hypothetical protein JAAARDRAFT_127948 [Jaapia argillacea MUCL 33604]|uniref:Protein ARV n=1 Tax=Jaapia argillacea MUCL 33604 TaxID=933084 RepID=A0A067PW93_9AGAM|nr:hypothetical protein JAAARDRAFT_127948 [Jaapia argillacea MUCL 33604]